MFFKLSLESSVTRSNTITNYKAKYRNNTMRPSLLFLFFICLSANIKAQDTRPNQEIFSLKISKAIDDIRLDGVIDEKTWEEVDVASDFWQKEPRDDIKASSVTEMRLSYDDNFLYVAGICYDTLEQERVIATLKRDQGFWDSDGLAVILDPLNEATTGFMFGTNPYGVQNEVLLGGGSGFSNYNRAWDNRWFVEAKQYPDRWTFEMAIPFKTLRYKSGQSVWGINFTRNDKKNNQIHSWAQVPRQFWSIDLGYAGRLIWDKAPEKKSGNIAVIPYVNASSAKDFESDEPTDYNFSAGADAKIALTSSLNLDLTVNPDFSQVEVDQQVTNLTRFNIFLPERRTFFLENSDVFTNFGIPSIRPFFSRRIGLDKSGQAVPIAFGARLTGNVTRDTRIGLLNVQTKDNDGQSGQNYTAAAFNQRLFGRTQLKGIFINRQAYSDGSFSESDYGRNGGLEFRYQSLDGTWTGWSGYHHSFKPDINDKNQFFNVGGSYTGKVISTTLDFVNIGTNYYADVGFVNRLNNYDALRDTVIRQGYKLMYFPIEGTFVPKNSNIINTHGFEMENVFFFDPEFKFVERNHEMGYGIEFKNNSEIGIGATFNQTDLRFPFSFTDGEPLPKGIYNYNTIGIRYESDDRKPLQFELEAGTGGFYNGKITSLGGAILYRAQPWGNFGLEVEYNDLTFPEPYGKDEIWAFSPRIEISFNRNLFWTTFLQYNTQADNFNINSRIQWRFAPMSDVFFVYTDNYAVQAFGPKNRAMVLKVNYWLAL